MYMTLNALDTAVTLVGPGDGIGEDVVPEGQLGVVLQCGGDAVMVVGTAQTLRSLVYDGLTHPVPDGVPLVDEIPQD